MLHSPRWLSCANVEQVVRNDVSPVHHHALPKHGHHFGQLCSSSWRKSCEKSPKKTGCPKWAHFSQLGLILGNFIQYFCAFYERINLWKVAANVKKVSKNQTLFQQLKCEAQTRPLKLGQLKHWKPPSKTRCNLQETRCEACFVPWMDSNFRFCWGTHILECKVWQGNKQIEKGFCTTPFVLRNTQQLCHQTRKEMSAKFLSKWQSFVMV